MKKVFFLVSVFCISSLFSQNTFQLWNFNAKKGMESAIATLADEQWVDAKFKSGGIQIERIDHGDNPWTHRIILFGEVGKLGRVDGDVEDAEWSLFQQKLNHYIEEWGTSYAGRFLSIEGGSWVDYPYVQIYDVKLNDPIAFKKAHDKLVKQTSKTRGDRPVAFGVYDIGGGKDVTHWVAVGSKNFNDLMAQKAIEETYVKEWTDWGKNNGGATIITNYTLRVLAGYANE